MISHWRTDYKAISAPARYLKRTYNEVFCLCHRDFTENQVGLPMVDPARLQAAQAVSQRNICDINKRPRHIFSLGIQSWFMSVSWARMANKTAVLTSKYVSCFTFVTYMFDGSWYSKLRLWFIAFLQTIKLEEISIPVVRSCVWILSELEICQR